MAKFSVNSRRLDPYKNFKFRIALSAAAGAVLGLIAGKLLDRSDRTGNRADG